MPNKPITGGDLIFLWKTAHMAIPATEEIYDDAEKAHKDKLHPGDEDTFGRCFPAWQNLQKATQFLIARSALSLKLTRKGLDSAIEEFSHVDGDNAKGLNDAGKELEDFTKNPGSIDDELAG